MATATADKVVYQKPAVVEATTEPPLSSAMENPNDVVEDRSAVQPPPPPHGNVDYDSSMANTANQTPDPCVAMRSSRGSHDRDVALAKVEDEKRLSFIKAWEESEKTKAENRAQKKFSEVSSWENSKKASLEAQLRKIEEQLEKKRADYAEKIRNKVALIHKEAEEKRAMVEARRGEEILKAEEMAAKYRATGHAPKKGFGCFGC